MLLGAAAWGSITDAAPCQAAVGLSTLTLHPGDACNMQFIVSFFGSIDALRAGFAQWKAIIHLLLGCEEGPLRSHVQLFVKALRCLLCQLQHSSTQVHALVPGMTHTYMYTARYAVHCWQLCGWTANQVISCCCCRSAALMS